MSSVLCKERVQQKAADIGFNRLRVGTVERSVALKHYDRFLSKGYHGTMDWMVRSRPPRANIYELLPSAQSIIVVGLDYWHPRPEKPNGLHGKVSCYAWGRDYHKIITKKLQQLAQSLRECDQGLEAYWTVDSRPVIERGWAEQTGLGFLGKNTMIISPGESSFFFLGTLIVNRDLEPDRAISLNHCGKCTRCLDRCPTNAFVAPFQMDARQCISYLTIEYDGIIEPKLATQMQDWILGCDVCQDVCPHNHRKWLSKHAELAPRQDHAWVDLQWLLESSETKILDHFAGSPIRRAGIQKLRRNAVIAWLNQEGEIPQRWIDYLPKESLAFRQWEACQQFEEKNTERGASE